MPDIMIELDELTKSFPGMEKPAVDHVSMSIPRGEIVVFVGPSGCGKTTTMKMINRLIEPTSGRIILDGEDVTKVDPNQLRRRIGYVIQQVGLFPHQTIAANIATVPQLLGWKSDRIRTRVDELLDLVGLDPSIYRDRYPKELSGGQRQRIGVARALAADPPVLLMDEPFGAIDPITRTRLQNEFLRLQADLQKTIVFVTHDIDEAIKMGDRIAILREGSSIAQFATPEEILTSPADDFVEDFVGAGAALKRLNLSRIRDVDIITDCCTGTIDEDLATLEARLQAHRWSSLLVLDQQGRPQRWLRAPDFRHTDRDVRQMGLPAVAIVEPQATLSDALDELLTGSVGVAIVVDRHGAFQGVVDIDTFTGAMAQMRSDSEAFYQAAKTARADGAGEAGEAGEVSA